VATGLVDDGTTLLLGLEGVSVERVEQTGDGTRIVHVVTADRSASACPECGVFSTSVKQNTITKPRDLPYGEQPLVLRWHKRRWRCVERECPRGSFTETLPQVPWGSRTTTRLWAACADAVADGRNVAEVARSLGVSWPTVQHAVDERAAAVLGEPVPTPVLGVDETRFGRPRWVRDPDSGAWCRTDPWQTGFVDLHGSQGLLGQVTGRTAAAVTEWLDARSEQWRQAVQVVVIDPHAGYRNGIRQRLPHATVVVDHFHLVALANKTVTEVRQRITQDHRGRRGRKTDPEWANRRRLLRGRERLTEAQFARMWNELVDGDPTGQILAAWIAKEELRGLLKVAKRGGYRNEISHRLWRFYDWCAKTTVPEVHALAETVQAWWPEIEAFLRLNITNAATEGTNRLVKHVKRAACGFRNEQHYRDRVRLHCARSKQHRASARTRRLPAQR
jgi:transposase